MRFDVAVVGAGPAGSASAISLARKGYSVALIDKAFFPREKLCGDFLSPINWPLFEQLGVADDLLSVEHEEVAAFRLSTCAGDEARIDFPVQAGRRRFGLGLRRFYLDDLLRRRADNEGVVVQQGCRIGALARDAEGWSIALEGHSAGKQLHSIFLLGADGRNSLVAHRLGLAPTSDGPTDYVAFQVRLTRRWSFPGEVQIHCFPGGYAGLVGLGGGAANLCFTVEKRRAKEERSVAALLEKFLCKNGFLRECLRKSEIVGDIRSAYPVYFPRRRCYGDGFLLAGDAARVTEPVTGEGIYFALKSGILAGEAIDGAFRRRNGAVERFAGYGRLCRQAFGYRQRMNRIIRGLIYRPSLLVPLVRLSSRTLFPLCPLIDRLCRS